MADEGDFLELLIANERVLQWTDELQTPGLSNKRKKDIVLQLQTHVESKSTYAEEARKAGVIPILTRILSSTDDPTAVRTLRGDEEVMEAVSAIMSACSGVMASGGKIGDYEYGGIKLRIREGALGDGLGARVWTVAHILCKEMAAHPGLLRGRQVLEIGAGCGVCGILAAKLGAAEVVLTDVEGPVLRNLRECMHLNGDKPTQPAASNSTHPKLDLLLGAQEEEQPSLPRKQDAANGIPDDAELFDDAESVDDLDLGQLLCVDDGSCDGSAAAAGAALRASDRVAAAAKGWEVGVMRVRTLDWLESLKALEVINAAAPGAAAGAAAASTNGGSAGGDAAQGLPTKQQHESDKQGAGTTLDPFYANDLLRLDPQWTLPGDMPPSVPLDEKYELIIGTDIMYEPMHARLVAAVLQHRLAPGGAALMCCAVRQARTFEAFTKECAGRALRYRQRQVYPATEYGGILGREQDYEGGFLLMAVDHAAQPSTLWHRTDFEPGEDAKLKHTSKA